MCGKTERGERQRGGKRVATERAEARGERERGETWRKCGEMTEREGERWKRWVARETEEAEIDVLLLFAEREILLLLFAERDLVTFCDLVCV